MQMKYFVFLEHMARRYLHCSLSSLLKLKSLSSSIQSSFFSFRFLLLVAWYLLLTLAVNQNLFGDTNALASVRCFKIVRS
jgi:hypothetical protein